MKAIILAGGQATRLRPITHNLPKCLLKIGKKTIIDFQIETLQKNNIKDIIIVTGFKAELLKEHIITNYSQTDITFTFVFNEKYETTHAAHSLWSARDYLTDTTIYLNSDLICDPMIIKSVIENKNDSVTAIQQNDWDEEEVNVITDENMNVVEIGKLIPEKLSKGEFIGATKLSSSFLNKLIEVLNDMVQKNDTKKFAVDAINNVIHSKGENLYALDVSHYVAIEIDTIEDFEKGKKLWEQYEIKG
ncbi:MAG: phosphocholine cytidylyltransferase family protein [Patescibacteria group bacterium]